MPTKTIDNAEITEAIAVIQSLTSVEVDILFKYWLHYVLETICWR